MSTQIDFSKPHPRTVLWIKQSSRCNKCIFQFSPAAAYDYTGLRCKATRTEGAAREGGKYAYCIDAREPGQPCGPKAALFLPKVES
jgi:hypothetical protein